MTPAGAPSPRIASREIRRRQLIDATIASIAELGLTETTLATVSGRAGLSHGTINFHFKSKDLLLAETLRFLAEEHRACWRAALASAGPEPEAQLAAMVEVDFDPAICNPMRLSVWLAFWGEFNTRPLYREVCSETDAERLGEFESLCQRIAGEGANCRANPAAIARSLQALIDGMWVNMLCQPEGYDNACALGMCLSYLEGCFPGRFGRPAEHS